ncbi:MAG: hypothetical protein APR55_09525 [Methanolinea sp. SDB]|nr:MAG: hypothetical protein APR55_09525 [Methanolinea sp. SDB]
MKRNKQVNAILYAIEEYPGIGRTKLMKFVFFVDLIIFNRRGETLLEDEYIRMPFGPVPPVAYALTSCSNEYIQVTRRYPSPRVVHYRFKPLQHADRGLFTGEEKGIFQEVLEVLRKNSATAVSALSHRYRLWREVGTGYTIPPDLFQLCEDDLEGTESGPFMADEEASDMAMECGIQEPELLKRPDILLMSEASLAKDWLRPEEDEAWADL